MLDANWSPQFTVVDIIANICELLAEPEHTSPIDSVLGELYRTDRKRYELAAAASAAPYARVPFNERCAAMEDASADGAAGGPATAASSSGSAAAKAAALPPVSGGKRSRATAAAQQAEAQLPPELLCSLTRTLFVAPIRTAEGLVYERAALEELIASGKTTDPVSGTVLVLADCSPADDVKAKVDVIRARLSA